ncbi:MAG: flagellar M-ring protein FliF [Waddliaceae bacterium]|nr:flagellar M-ring protein FliF [Waddliaceae bacterium]
MDLESIKNIGRQLAKVWKDIKTYQKFTVVMVALTLLATMAVLVFNAAANNYTPLFPAGRLSITDAADIKGYLDSARINYKIRSDTLIMVNEKDVHRVRMDLATVGIPKQNASKGFELFDTNTWIKGEKELQVLEMRALIGQLEQDITEYESIRGASVMLDIAPPRPFGGAMYKSKASVILTLMPGGRISASQLRAITYHVSGSVRGLMPNMVAISDNTGKLYQALDPDGNADMLRSAEFSLEERLKSKIDGMLAMIVGHGNFYSTVQVSMNRDKTIRERKVFSGEVDGVQLGEAVVQSVTESGSQMTERERMEMGTPGSNTEAVAGAVAGEGGQVLNRDESRNQQVRQMAVPIDHVKTNTTPGTIENISIGVMVDKTITVDSLADIPESEIQNGLRGTEILRTEIESQLAKILEGYGLRAQPAVDFVEFDHTRVMKQAAEESWGSMLAMATQIATIIFVLITVFGMFWSFNRFWRRHMLRPPTLEQDEEDIDMHFIEEPSLVEVEAMVEAIKTRFQNDPHTVVETVRDWLVDQDQTVNKF